MANQNLSQETQAIIDRLKAEGDLIRNSGTNSIRAVKINLDRFEGIFNTISSNIAEQTNILRVQNGIAQEQLEKQRTQEQFDEIAQAEKVVDKDPTGNGKLVTDQENAKINKMGDSIAAALSLKNIALAGAGMFIGYNFLKGFIDEKTGGGFTEFENNIGPFARELPETMRSLQRFARELPETVRETSEDLKKSLRDMETNIREMTTEVTRLTTKLGEVLDNFTSLGAMIGALVSAISVWNLAGLAREMTRFINNRFPRTTIPTTTPPRTPTTSPSRTPVLGPDGNPLSELPGRDPVTGRMTPSPATQARRAAAAAAELPAPPAPSGAGAGRGRINEAPGARAAALRAQAGTAAKNITDIESSISNPKMRRVFAKLLKGFAVLGIAMTIYQAGQLAALLNDENVSESEKIAATGAFIGELVGGATLSVGLGVLATTFGPWGTLIGALVGGVIGTFAGGWLGEYIAKWAFDESPDARDIEASREMSGIDGYYRIEARPTDSGIQGDYARAAWDDQFGSTYNPDGTLKSATGSGRGNVFEQPGERAAYARAQEGLQLDALIRAEQQRQAEDSARAQEIQDIENYLGIQRNNTTGRMTGSELLGANAAGGGPTIINAPTIAPSSVNVSNGGSSVNQLSISNGGGGMGPSMLPYGLTGAFS